MHVLFFQVYELLLFETQWRITPSGVVYLFALEGASPIGIEHKTLDSLDEARLYRSGLNSTYTKFCTSYGMQSLL